VTARDTVVSFAQQQIGKPYRWGATGPDGYDCSGLVYAAYRAAGLHMPRLTASQMGKTGQAVPVDQAKPGDIVYYDEPGAVDHVGIYVGNHQMIDAPTQGKPVETVDIGNPTAIRDWSMGGDSAGDVAKTVASAAGINVSGWQSEALSIGLKVAAVAVCGGLLIVGAKQTVTSGA